MHGGVEEEVKIPISDPAQMETQLRAVGFAVVVPRLFEANTVYDKGEKELQANGMLLRLRHAGEKSVITWKGPEQPGPHKSRPEIETTLGSADVLGQILERLGYAPAFRYEKYRTEYRRMEDGAGTVTLDETPIGNFMELEGPAEWIDNTARQLGFKQEDYVLASYGKLYLADCERRGVRATNMIFAS